MKPAPFDFRAPPDLAGVLDLLAEYGEDGRVLAGGQSLVPLMNLRMVQPAMLISINRCDDLDTIARQDDRLICGARVRQVAAEESELVQQDCPLLAAALPYVGGQANRNRGTVCGSLAHADPLAELPAVALALDAEMHVATRSGRRRIAAQDFFVGELDTALQPGEFLEAVAFQRQDADERCAFLELGNRRHGFAVAGLALRLGVQDGRCVLARVAVMGGGATARRISAVEAALEGTLIDEIAIAAAVAALSEAVVPPVDVHADAEYRRHALGVLLERALRSEED
jgi:CO/xanthine dehydrogenase FAD-binding subunit